MACTVVGWEESEAPEGPGTRASSRRSEQIIVAPWEAKERAIARPMPDEEPVMTATLSARRLVMLGVWQITLFKRLLESQDRDGMVKLSSNENIGHKKLNCFRILCICGTVAMSTLIVEPKVDV